jgi:hypothetical protein
MCVAKKNKYRKGGVFWLLGTGERITHNTSVRSRRQEHASNADCATKLKIWCNPTLRDIIEDPQDDRQYST